MRLEENIPHCINDHPESDYFPMTADMCFILQINFKAPHVIVFIHLELLKRH